MINAFERIEMLKEAKTVAIENLDKQIDEIWRKSIPPEWKVGMKVQYLQDQEWVWRKGTIAYITELRPDIRQNKKPSGSDFQVLMTSPHPDTNYPRWCTTPFDIVWIDD